MKVISCAPKVVFKYWKSLTLFLSCFNYFFSWMGPRVARVMEIKANSASVEVEGEAVLGKIRGYRGLGQKVQEVLNSIIGYIAG